MKKRLTALLCAMVVCLCTFRSHAINAGDVYFTSVNDVLRPLTMDTMPTWVDGRLYVPASVFDSSVTGVDLGLYFRQNNNTVTLYSLRQMLVFDLNRGIAYDQHAGESLPTRAVNRNGRIYLPVETVCNFFALEDSYNYTQYGYLVRIKNASARHNDAAFIDNAATTMSNSLQELLRSQQSSDSPTPPAGIDQPTPPPAGPDDTPKSHAQVYLAFRCQSAQGFPQILDQLDSYGLQAIFFFDPELLALQDDLVRRIIGSGHSIGLLAEGSNPDESRLLLSQGNELLAHIAHTAATAALVPADQQVTLAEEGWACWRETMNTQPRETERASSYAQRILTAIGTRRTVRLTLDDSAQTARVLPSLLQQLENNEHRVLLPLETRF